MGMDEFLAAVRRLVELSKLATARPWETGRGGDGMPTVEPWVCSSDGYMMTQENAEFIAYAANIAEPLAQAFLAGVDEYEAMLKKIKDEKELSKKYFEYWQGDQTRLQYWQKKAADLELALKETMEVKDAVILD
jgi:hypothetical protein